MRHGFTLIEAALVLVIVGVGFLSMLTLLAAGTRSNHESTELTTGIHLANCIAEMTTGMYFTEPKLTTPHFGRDSGESVSNPATLDDLDDLHNVTFSPPVDARKVSLGSEFAGWSQTILVQNINPLDIDASLPVAQGSTDFVRVTVQVKRNGELVHAQSWIVTNPPQN
jgi:type II secretory pathway pseudopilin PulG